MDECAVTSEKSVFNIVKIANSNVRPTLRGFRCYPDVFCGLGVVSAIKAGK